MPNPSNDTNQSRTPHPSHPIGLGEFLRDLETERERTDRRRLRQILFIGVGLSLVVHICLMIILAMNYRFVPGPPSATPVSYDIAILQEEQLTELESTELEEPVPEISNLAEDIAMDDPSALDPAVPAAELEIASSGAMPALGGSGDGEGSGGSLGGGGAGATFFGVSSRGLRFAYIVDRSGSMRESSKMLTAKRELARSIDGLPDYASFIVVFFSTNPEAPPMQDGWMRAREQIVSRFIRWLNQVDPGGGTEPVPAFDLVFAMAARPDVIFFLTDGQIPDDTADLVAALNSRGKRVIVNTIAFGDPTSQDLLKQIARDSGGVYRFVPAEFP